MQSVIKVISIIFVSLIICSCEKKCLEDICIGMTRGELHEREYKHFLKIEKLESYKKKVARVNLSGESYDVISEPIIFNEKVCRLQFYVKDDFPANYENVEIFFKALSILNIQERFPGEDLFYFLDRIELDKNFLKFSWSAIKVNKVHLINVYVTSSKPCPGQNL